MSRFSCELVNPPLGSGSARIVWLKVRDRCEEPSMSSWYCLWIRAQGLKLGFGAAATSAAFCFELSPGSVHGWRCTEWGFLGVGWGGLAVWVSSGEKPLSSTQSPGVFILIDLNRSQGWWEITLNRCLLNDHHLTLGTFKKNLSSWEIWCKSSN